MAEKSMICGGSLLFRFFRSSSLRSRWSGVGHGCSDFFAVLRWEVDDLVWVMAVQIFSQFFVLCRPFSKSQTRLFTWILCSDRCFTYRITAVVSRVEYFGCCLFIWGLEVFHEFRGDPSFRSQSWQLSRSIPSPLMFLGLSTIIELYCLNSL